LTKTTKCGKICDKHFLGRELEEKMKKLVFGLIMVFVACFCFAHTPSYEIMSEGELPRDVLVSFLKANNPRIDIYMAIKVVELYMSEAEDEGVNYVIAFAQMCYHTNYLSFNKTFVSANSYNFYGAASLWSNYTAHNFDSYQTSIRAHIQHLKGYATREPLRKDCVDPRYDNIEEAYGWGSSPTIHGLSNRWGGYNYSNNIRNILTRIYFY
jgi:hypothetical protein